MSVSEHQSRRGVHPIWRLATIVMLSGLFVHALVAHKALPPAVSISSTSIEQLPPSDPRLQHKFDRIDYDRLPREKIIIDLPKRAGLNIVVRAAEDDLENVGPKEFSLHLKNSTIVDALNELTNNPPLWTWCEYSGLIYASDVSLNDDNPTPVVYDVRSLLEHHEAEETRRLTLANTSPTGPQPAVDPFHRADWLTEKILSSIPYCVTDVKGFGVVKKAISFEPDKLIILSSFQGHRQIEKLLWRLGKQ